MNVLVTGAKGMLGAEMVRVLEQAGHTVRAADRHDLDVRDPARVRAVMDESNPELVCHLAALTDVDGCERQPDEAYHTNTVGTQVMALACQARDVPLVYVSSISVYDGTKSEAYTEFDTPNPQSHYGRSKHQGERIVQQLLRRYYIVRAGWMFGGGALDKKFVAKIIDRARSTPTLTAVDDKFGSPTYTHDFAQAVLKLAATGWYGVYHAVGAGAPASRYVFAQKILELAGINNCTVQPVSSADFPLPAPRPRMEAGRNLHAELLGLDLMRPWEAALQDYIQELGL